MELHEVYVYVGWSIMDAALIKEKRVIKRDIVRQCQRIGEYAKKEMTRPIFTQMLCELQSVTEQKRCYDELVKRLIREMDDKAPTVTKDEDLFKEKDEVSYMYNLACSRVRLHESELSQRSSRDSLNSSAMLSDGNVHVKLPKIEILEFNGDPRNWNDFKDLFKNLVKEEPYILNVQCSKAVLLEICANR